MPSWKKVVASGSDASFSSVSVDTFVSASSFKGSFTGSLQGTSSQSISSSYAQTASYALNAGGGLSSITIATAGTTQGTASYFNFTNAVSASFNSATASFFITNTPLGTSVTFTQSIAANTWSFSHGVGSRTPIVQAYDNNYDQIIPTRIFSPTPFQTNLYFDVAELGYAIISTGGTVTASGSNSILTQASPATTWSFNHNLGTKYPVFTIFDDSDNVIVPQRIFAQDSASAFVYFSSPTAGRAVAALGGLTNNTASFALTASYVVNAISSSYALTASYVSGSSISSISASYATNASSSLIAVSASYAATASYLLGYISPFPYSGSAQITGSLGVTGSINSTGNITTTGTLTAQTLVVQTITSSIEYSSGSNIFGSQLTDRQTFTGSVNITGSLNIVGAVSGSSGFTGSFSGSFSGAITGSLFGTASQAISASYAYTASSSVSASYAYTASSAVSASYVLNAISSSYAFTASSAISSSFANSSSVAYSGTGSFTGSFIGIYTGSLFGTASQALTASYLLGYISPFPFSGSAQITGSLGITGSIISQISSGRAITSTTSDTSLAPLLLTNNAVGTYINTLDMLAPNLTAAQSVAFTLGRVASANNTVGFNFYYAGAGSTSNAATFTFYGGSPLLWLRANGNLHLGTATDSGYKLDVNGSTRIQSGLIVSGSTIITGSLAITGSVYISGSLLLNQSTSSLGISTQTVSTNSTSSYTSAFYRYSVVSGSNARAGEFIACWNGSSIQYTDYSTTDIGNTSLVSFTASLSSGNVVLTTVLPTSGWNVNTLVNLL